MFEDIVKVAFIGVFTAIIVVLLKNTKTEISVPLTLTGCVLILGVITGRLASVLHSLTGIYDSAGLKGEEAITLLKIMGTAYVTEIAAATCRDAQETALAGKIELAGRVCIVYLSLPMAVSLLSTLKNLF